VWTLPLPSVAEVDAQLTAALTYANGDPVYLLSAAERIAVRVVYHAYDALLGQPDPSLMPPALIACREYIGSGYSQVQIGGRLAELRATILAIADICPYCGFGEPTQLDHFLPKADFDELAIYPRNLIPSCGPCNNAKRSVVPGLGGGPGLIHPYFQGLPDLPFLRADVSFVAGTLDVTFNIDAGLLAPALASILQYQLVRLKLHERYIRQVNKFLFEQRTAILMLNEIGPVPIVLQQYFARAATSLTGVFGRNDWRVALVNTLATHVEFCANPTHYLGAEQLGD
jgi:hypothetical protein